ncbi:YicC/YloC family endoribonuclease [Fulvimarina endophytica]|uniref:YicC/YloC family endoribonuclease n=1 Tax=Fulvimarina endophytica TaxID=2293836 RepID=UPI0011C02474|nr:YicC/YloC family endoribonuclease [Fulvimarina endophytica]
MSLRSMTGFARSQARSSNASLVWELKSVNGRGLDLRLRMPAGFDALEPDVRALASRYLARGSVQINLTVEWDERPSALQVDRDRLTLVLQISDELVASGRASLPRTDGLLGLKGIIEWEQAQDGAPTLQDDLIRASKESFAEAVEQLRQARQEEGRSLGRVIAALLDRIGALARDAREERTRHPEFLRLRIAEQAARLAEQAIDEQRLVQELALIAVRADISEELDRLDSHIDAAHGLLAANEPVGRRFDFLTQEMNRESNTICSKSNSVALTAIGLDLKVAVDQLREQVQNIE